MKPLKLLAGLALLFTTSVYAETPEIILTKDNVIKLEGPVRTSSAAAVVQKAKELDSILKSGDPIYLVLDTPGGSITAGLEMIENLRNLNRPVHTITLFGASMGFQTVQGLGNRYITRDGTLMSHKAWGRMQGEFPGQFDSRYNYWLTRVKRMAERTVVRTNGKHTLKSYRALIENEYWCDGRDCLEQGFVDAIVAPKCDDSISGTYTDTLDAGMEATPFGMLKWELKAKRSSCPLITGALGWDLYIDGQPLKGTLEPKVTKRTDDHDYWSQELEIKKTAALSSIINGLYKKASDRVENFNTREVVLLP